MQAKQKRLATYLGLARREITQGGQRWASQVMWVSRLVVWVIVEGIAAETKNSNGAVELRLRHNPKPATRLEHGHELNKANTENEIARHKG